MKNNANTTFAASLLLCGILLLILSVSYGNISTACKQTSGFSWGALFEAIAGALILGYGAWILYLEYAPKIPSILLPPENIPIPSPPLPVNPPIPVVRPVVPQRAQPMAQAQPQPQAQAQQSRVSAPAQR